MRNLHELDRFRLNATDTYGWSGDSTCGCFQIKSEIDGAHISIVASTGRGWDHVSVSRTNRCPNWPEMEQVKRLFFEDDETAVQFHVPASDHINNHPHCLHLWRPNEGQEIPRPPAIMVGIPASPEIVAELIRRKRA